MRLFLGVPAPPSPAYADVTRSLLQVRPAARPVPDGTWHCTLRFVGELDSSDALVAALDPALAGHPSLPCAVRGVGAFPEPRRARVVWAAIQAPGLDGLADAAREATRGIGQPEERGFVGHVTLARLRDPADLRPWLQGHRDRVLAEGVLDRVVLFRSVLGPQGPSYEGIHAWRLAAPKGGGPAPAAGTAAPPP